MRIFLFILLIASVYSQTAKKFKSEKINYIYEKAVNQLDDATRLNRLEKELGSYDTLYIDTKHEYAHSDPVILRKEMGKIDKKLIKLLDKYGLESTVNAFKEKIKHGNEYRTTQDFDANEVSFEDERLDKLWKSALENGFSSDEMKELYSELKDAERLMEEHDEAKQALNKVPHENDLHFDHEDDVKQVTDNEKRLKETHKRLDSHLDNIQKKVESEEKLPFGTDKVKKMWKLARSNKKFSSDDLKILEEELIHFDKQIRKFDEHVNLKENRKDKTQLEHLEDVEMDAKQERMARKMRKLEKYLQSKVQHAEL